MNLNQLPRDYRLFGNSRLPYSFSNRLLNPVLYIDRQNGKYCVFLGAKVKKENNRQFIACSSNEHNWLFDNDRIKPLPHDAPKLLNNVIPERIQKNLSYPDVIRLKREGIEGIDIELSAEVTDSANARSATMSLPSPTEGLNATLYPYQERGVAWLCDSLETLGGAILADEMGLGKTLQIIAVFLRNRPTPENPALIVCPTTLIANWSRELYKFSPNLTLQVHRGSERSGFYKDLMRSEVVITTYDTLVNDIAMFRGVDWSYVVCDEAQAVKNPESKRRNVVSLLPRRFTIPVTGTPIENSLVDLWSLADIAIPGILGTKESFTEFYPDTEQGAKDLSYVIDTILLKRRVKDVANDLPARTEVDFPVELDSVGSSEYERIRKETVSEYGSAGNLVAVGQLALYCAHPWLRTKQLGLPNWDDDIELTLVQSSPLMTPKLELCIQLIREAVLSKKKVLVFVAYNNCGELIEKAAAERGVKVDFWSSINGSTPQQERQSIVDQFTKAEASAILILNPKAAGSGLNITAANVVIHYTQNWNPAIEMQASARAHRRGQERPVTIYRLFYQHTVEEIMIQRSLWKRELGEEAIAIASHDKSDLRKALKESPAEGIK
ncbi:DEAD/DEAH box helicase [Idiomarina abyssalis]|uniref:DEAD/DEAH box helicase n=1 Tax=Idiomarina abyssalis TaxID=86102 RepID=UPI0006C8488A|nr:DEAD/DEAH box helicase [Idiomarina abyssalis]KPD21007.1 helicase [Idiomarina abyssalis]SFT84135.1 Helicase conserved C-terminal domain-containing protein [Idiomarina abyssalis]